MTARAGGSTLVEFHPAYHALMRRSVASGLHSSIWENGAAETGRRHQVRAARFYLTAQLETGHLCPITMTSASLAALMASPQLFREWAPRITTRKYDQSQKPPVEKTGLTLGMGMTEKQGGTDVRANTTKAERAGSGFYPADRPQMVHVGADVGRFPGAGAGGRGAVVLPGAALSWATASSNGFRFQRLKDKLGNRSNASSEVEFVSAIGEMVGEPGAGIKTIMDMVTLTRLDCAVASSGLMRAGLAEAVHHTRHRAVFGQKLVDQPLMQRVLADMALDVAGAPALSFRLARSFDEAASRPGGGGLRPRHDAGREILGLQDRAGAALRGDGVPRRQRLCRGDAACRATIARRRSTPSGRAPATSWRSTCCACWRARPACSTRCSPASSTISARAGPATVDVLRARPCRWRARTRARRAS